jgi:hypothetical protein
VNGDRELVGRELEPLGQKLPGPHDRFALVVVAEREVAEHLEERAVPSRPSDVLDIAFRAGDA